MTEERRANAFKYIEAQLNNGYIDLGLNDEDELEIVDKERTVGNVNHSI